MTKFTLTVQDIDYESLQLDTTPDVDGAASVWFRLSDHELLFFREELEQIRDFITEALER